MAVNLNKTAAACDLLFCISAVKFASRNFAARRKVAQFVRLGATTLVTLRLTGK